VIDSKPGPTFREQLAADSARVDPPIAPNPNEEGAVGKTLFDLPASTDLTVTVVVPKDKLSAVPAQSLVRIKSRTDGRTYLGVVTAGPFAEPDGLRGDSPMLTAVATHGGNYLPPYHGRFQVTILGEELKDGALTPPRLRPVPNSSVFVLTSAEAGKALKCGGEVRLGLAVGYEDVVVGAPARAKSAFPRHTAVLGTTGGGKSTTVAGLIARARGEGMAVIVLDVEGEYTVLHEPADHVPMCEALRDRGLSPGGVPARDMAVYHLVGRDTANPAHPNRKEFALQFARLSPHAVMEILGLSEAQQERFLKAYDIAKELMRDLDIFPKKGSAEQQRLALETDEYERGYPRMTLALLMDVVGACLARADKGPKDGRGKGKKADEDDEDVPAAFEWRTPVLRTSEGKSKLATRVNAANPPGNAISWRAVLGRLARLNRMKVFHDDGPPPMTYAHLIKPGTVSIIDLSDSGYSELSNLVIADILRGVQDEQETAYTAYEAARAKGDSKAEAPRVLIVIEEAHEFLSEERVSKTPVLFEQVAKIAKRGRKRWLGLCFVTQLPSHLPKQVLGLCNSFILHKLQDPQVVTLLKRTVGGVDEGLWDRLPNLAAGQAVVSFPHFSRPLLVSVDPSQAKLRLTE
jgi:DNA helicase HerA-like ATPase